MTRRCKPGQRARIINSSTNTGAVVLIVRHYCGELINGGLWIYAMFPWVVTSLGRPLDSWNRSTQQLYAPAMTIVVDDCDLVPLDDDAGGLFVEEGVDVSVRVA